MASSTRRYTVVGTPLALLDLNIEYFDRSEITVFFNDVVSPVGTLWDWSGISDKRILFTPEVPIGVSVLIKRTTDITKLRHSYTQGAAFTAATLDEDLTQVLHIAQESTESNVATDFFNDVDMHKFRLHNLGAAVDPQDAVTLEQYTADLVVLVAAADAATAAAADAVAAASAASAAAAAALDAANTALAGNLTGSVNFKRAAIVATATTTPLWTSTNGNVQDWTGSPTITALPNAPQAGATRVVYPAAGTIITNGGSISVQGAANYTIVAGDELIITAITTTTFYVTVKKKSGSIICTHTNNNAAAGDIGESISSTVPPGSGVSLTPGVTSNITSISLTAGDWDVSLNGSINYVNANVNGSANVSISAVSAALEDITQAGGYFPTPPLSHSFSGAVAATRFSLTATTTIYFTARSNFSTGTANVIGTLSARRVR